MKDHELAELFPLMEKDELKELAADIKINGQRAPITTLDGKILDGRNRHRACAIAGIDPKLREFTGSDPLGFVLSANLHRRHLSESQRAMVAAKIANLPRGRSEKIKSANLPITPPITQAAAAQALNVSTRAVTDAKAVLGAGKAATKAVESGAKTVSAAAKEVRAKKAEKDKPEFVRDSTGYAIPEKLLSLWNRIGEVKAIQLLVLRAEQALKAVSEGDGIGKDFLWKGFNVQAQTIALHNCRRDLDAVIPHAVCPICSGRHPDSCTACKGRGFISKHHFENTVPVELKAIRAKSCVN